MNASSDNAAQAVLWMLAQLNPSTQDRVRRRLALRVDPPISPTERRRQELRFVSDLLRVFAPRAGWSFAYMQRKQYDADRPPDAPSSAVLVERYGSWVEICRHAHALATRGSLLPGPPHSRPFDRTRRRYSRDEVVAALQECTREVNRAPSGGAYSLWRLAAERRRSTCRYPSETTVTRIYEERGGWRGALEDAGLLEPPAMTVRAVLPSVELAAEITEALRAAGLVTTRSHRSRCVEIRAMLTEVRRAIVRNANAHSTVTVTLWEPRSGTLLCLDPVACPHPARQNLVATS